MRRQDRTSGAAKIISSVVPNVTTLSSFLMKWLDQERHHAIRAHRCAKFNAFLKGTLIGSLAPVPAFTPDPNVTCINDVLNQHTNAKLMYLGYLEVDWSCSK